MDREKKKNLKSLLLRLKAVADMRLLLAVFVAVLGVMGIFAYSFRQIQAGFVEEDGYLVTSRDIYDRLKGEPAEDEKNILLAGVSRDTELFERGGKSYVGEAMEEYEADYPMYSNNGTSLHFLNDSASLVTEDFELQTTYAGMYVAGGNSYNRDREQADAETIFFVKLKNSLYENALPMTLKKTSGETVAPVNSIVWFGDQSLRFYKIQNGTLSYEAVNDVDGLSVEIGDHTYTYEELRTLLNGAKEEVKTEAPEDAASEETPSDDEQQELGAGTIIPENGGSSSEGSQKDQTEKELADHENGTDGETIGTSEGPSGQAGAAGSSSAGSDKSGSGSGDKGGSGSDKSHSGSSGDDHKNDASNGTNSGNSGSSDAAVAPVQPDSGDSDNTGKDDKPSQNQKPSSTITDSREQPYIKPQITISNVKTGTYTLDYDVEIKDEGSNLKKLTAYVSWPGGQQRKTIREAGHMRLDNIRSGQKLTFRVEMKYRYKDNQYYTETVYMTTDLSTMTIEEGTNTLYLDYTADAWDEATGEGGYDYILPHQLEIRDLHVTEGTDSKAENASSTMDYARYFRVQVYEDNMAHDLVQNFPLSNAQKKAVVKDGGINWRSDTETYSLDSDSTYYYDFEIMDMYGDSLKVVYADDTRSYDENGKKLDPWNSDREAYTCRDHLTGRLMMGSASYDGQKVSVTLTNKDKAKVTDLYLTVQDIYGRYIEYDNDTGTASIGTGELTDNARFMFMKGVIGRNGTELPIYAGIRGANKSPYDPDSAKQSWENLEIPAFANSTYRISLNVTYDIGDRYGDIVDGQRSGTYTKVLAVRNNCKTTSISSLGSVAFSRNAGESGSHSVIYNYTSGSVTEKLQPLIYRHEYTLAKQDTPDDKLFTLRVSKEFEEIKKESQGVILNLPKYGEQKADDWHFGYSATYRDRNDRSTHTVTGELYEKNGFVVRTIYVDGEERDSISTPLDSTNRFAAWSKALDLEDLKVILGADADDPNLSLEQPARVSLYFAPVTSGSDIVLDVNENYSFNILAERMKTAVEYASSEGMTAEEQDFSDVVLYALSNFQAQLTVEINGLDSASRYVADARADAYQSGSLTALEKTDKDGNTVYESGDPVITSVTVTDATLKLYTLKGEPYVNMDLFVDANQISLFGFYVLDEDGTILEPKAGQGKAIRVQLFEYTPATEDKDAVETLVSTIDNLTAIDQLTYDKDGKVEGSQTLTFSGLTKGQLYRIKVYALRYDVTPDGSKTVKNQLIGEKNGSTFWKDNGIWEGETGSAISTGLSIEEMVAEDPEVLATQLIDFSTVENEGSGWEVGNFSTTTMSGDGNTYYRVTPFIDIRTATVTEEGHLMKELDPELTLIAKGSRRLYAFDEEKNYLGAIDYLYNGKDVENSWAVMTLPQFAEPVAYVRMQFYYNAYNNAFLGILNKDYMTRSKNIGNTGTAVKETFGTDFVDIVGALNNGHNYYEDIKDSRNTTAGVFTNTDGGTSRLNNYYTQEIPITGNDLFQVMSFNSSGSAYETEVYFLNAAGQLIMNKRDTAVDGGSDSVARKVYLGRIFVAPKNAVKMLVAYNGNDPTAQRYEIHILKGTENGAAAAYRKWGQANVISADKYTVNRALNADGTTYTVGSNNYHVLNDAIAVTPGDIYYINNWGQRILLLDKDGKVISSMSSSTDRGPYLIIPDGVAAIKVGHYNWSRNSMAYDTGFGNGFAYNQDGAFEMILLKCGNLKDVYQQHMGSSDRYANLRVQLSDGISNYFTNNLTQDGAYYLEIYERALGDHEWSDEELMDTSAGAVRTVTDPETIHLLTNPDGSKASEVINVCRTIPVKKGYGYKVVLHAQVGRKGDVALGRVYFNVDSAGTEIRGIDSADQLVGIRSNIYGNYILNRDITWDAERYPETDPYVYYIPSFYGDIDLQGHTFHQTRQGRLISNLGSAAKKQGSIRNGTIWLDIERTKDWSYNYFLGNNYGTLENLNFRLAIRDQKNGDSTYNRQYWTKVSGNVIGSNYGTIRNFTVNYEEELGSAQWASLLYGNYGLVENGYAYGKGVRGGGRVGGIIAQNMSRGTARYLYSLVNARSNDTKYVENWANSTSYNGTVIAENSGKAYGLLSTGNTYTYTTTISGTNYEFDNEMNYSLKGNTVGVTDTKMDTKDCYYATVGNDSRVDYADLRNERVESGMLTEASWYRSVFGNDCLDNDNLEKLLSDGYYPWISMGTAAEKYSMKQPYLPLETGSEGAFDLLKTEKLSSSFNDDGFETIRMKFSFANDNGYEVTDILPDGLDCVIVSQQKNEESGYYEVIADLRVAEEGSYTSNYPVKSVYYRNGENAPKSSVKYSYGSYASTNGSRILDISFYYPLKNFSEWDTMFVNNNNNWNFRIWGEEQEWDFLTTYTNESGKTVYPNPVKNFTYSGKLDGTWYGKNDAGVWEVKRDDFGNPKSHVLKNMWDYEINYNSSGVVTSYYLRGYIFYQLNGDLSNLTFKNASIGIERPEHRALKKMTASQIGEDLENPFGDGTGTVRRHRGAADENAIIRYVNGNVTVDNVHVENSVVATDRNGSEWMGGLASKTGSQAAFRNCSTVDQKMISSTNAAGLGAGGLVAYPGNYSTFDHCFVTGLNMELPVSANKSFNSYGSGGLIGYVSSSCTITSCYTAGRITTDVLNTAGMAGRLAGTSEITGSYSAVNVSTSTTSAAGLVAFNEGTLELNDCLYTGSLNAASSSNTIHLMVGNNTSTLTVSDCWAYQPHMEETSSLLDGAGLVEYDKLGEDFYRGLFGEEYLYHWDSIGVGKDEGSYLPALAGTLETTAEDGSTSSVSTVQYGQYVDGRCRVPSVADESLEIRDVWAFATDDREALEALPEEKQVPASVKNQTHHIKPNGGGTADQWFAQLIQNLNTGKPAEEQLSYYEPNDLVFTLVTGAQDYKIRSITVDGMTSGGLLQQQNLIDSTGLLTADGIGAKTYYAWVEENGDSSADCRIYDITLAGMEVASYRDSYTVSVELENGVTISQTFQFRNKNGDEEAKYLKISNAYEWNLYMGVSGDLPALAAEGADPVLAKYKNAKYMGYGISGMNVEIEDTIDFSVLEALNEQVVTNVTVNNLRGATTKADSGATVTKGIIKNLTLIKQPSQVYGLFQRVNGSMSWLDFENINIGWVKNCPTRSGIIGTLGGDAEYCNFTDIVLTGGRDRFGMIGESYGSLTHMKLVNLYVESDASYAGGLCGYLRGDLMYIEASEDLTRYAEGEEPYGYAVTGKNYTGGLAGIILSSDHEQNGHVLIGGRDYLTDNGIPLTERDLMNPEGWYYQNIIQPGYYPEDAWKQSGYDSLGWNYARIENITLNGIQATSQNTFAGGLAGYTSYNQKTMGYGYVLLEKIKAENVNVTAKNLGNSADSYAGGLFGRIMAFMGHKITITGARVDASTGSYAGAFYGYKQWHYDYDYSAFYTEDERASSFISNLNDITVSDCTVSGAARVGGIGGYNDIIINTVGAKVHNVTVLSEGERTGGVYGNSGYYIRDLDASGIRVYSAGAEAQYVGGIIGTDARGQKWTVDDVQVIASGTGASYTGGVTGTGLTMKNSAEETSHMTNIQVSGNNLVGGITGSSLETTNLEVAHVEVTGKGSQVGGLQANSGSTKRYLKASDIRVRGGGAMIGGIIGGGTGGITLYNSTISDVEVVAYGDATQLSDVTPYGGTIWHPDTAEPASNGSYVGGILGTFAGGSIQRITIENISVYATGSNVGGIAGGIQGAISRVNGKNIRVHAEGTENVGGGAGRMIDNSMEANVLLDASVTAPNASNVGGLIGRMEYQASDNYSGASYNTVKAVISAGSKQADGAVTSVGGLVGSVQNTRTIALNTVEADIRAAHVSEVGGLVGTWEKGTCPNPYNNEYYNIVTAKVVGYDMVSGLTGLYRQAIYYKGMSVYRNLAAVDVTALKSGGYASFFYNMQKDEGGTVVQDQNLYNGPNEADRPYPYLLKLWDDSKITVGGTADADGNVSGGTTTTATAKQFGSPEAAYNNKTTGYWRDSEITASRNKNGNLIALVTTNDMQNRRLYYGGTDHMSFTMDNVTYEEGSNVVTYPNLSELVPTSLNRLNWLGFYKDFTGSDDVRYLPVPLPMLHMVNELTANVNNDDYRSGYYDESQWFIGTGTLVGGSIDNNKVQYTITDGIRVPGTAGSLLSGGNSTLKDVLANIKLVAAPRVYASSGYTLNVDFSEKDLFKGVVLEMSKADVTSGGTSSGGTSGDGSTSGTTTGSGAAAYSITTEEGNLSYTMYYDFQTPMKIEMAAYGVNDDGAQERAVLMTIDVNPADYRSRVAASNMLYRITSSGTVYGYSTSNAPESDRTDVVNTKLKQGEKLIHIKAESSTTISGITDKGRIIAVTGAIGEYDDKILPNFVGKKEDILTGGTTTDPGENPDGGDTAPGTGDDTGTGQDAGDAGTEQSGAVAGTLRAADNKGSIMTEIKEMGLSLYASASLDTQASSGVVPASEPKNLDEESGADSATEGGDNTVADADSTTDNDAITGETSEETPEQIGGENDSLDDTEETPEQIGGEIDSLDDTEETVDFDESLLTADPLYEFDYKGLHICTYVTYSLIFDGDQVTMRNMQLFVKNGRLFAINAPDQMVPGNIIIDEYQGHTYMTVLSRSGRMVDLMDEIHYPDGFVNYNIKNISTNLYSDLASVQVEYEDGSIIAFNYLTGGVFYEEEGTGTEGEGTADESDFLDYIMAFFSEKFDTAYGEVTNAYQNAVSMADYLAVQPWRDWFASTSGVRNSAAADNAEDAMMEEQDPEQDLPAEVEQGKDTSDQVALTLGGGSPETEETDASTSISAEDKTKTASTDMGGMVADEESSAVTASDDDSAVTDISAGVPAADADAQAAVSESAETETSETPGTPADATASESTGTETDGTAQTSEALATEEQDPLGDDLIIAYDADSDGYALYAENDLLREDQDSLVSVDQQMQQYLAAGGKEVSASTATMNLQVSRAQQKGFIVLGITAGLILCMILALGIQRYAKKDRRRSGRK